MNTGWDGEDIRGSGYRSPVAGGEEVAVGSEVVAGVRVLPCRWHL